MLIKNKFKIYLLIIILSLFLIGCNTNNDIEFLEITKFNYSTFIDEELLGFWSNDRYIHENIEFINDKKNIKILMIIYNKTFFKEKYSSTIYQYMFSSNIDNNKYLFIKKETLEFKKGLNFIELKNKLKKLTETSDSDFLDVKLSNNYYCLKYHVLKNEKKFILYFFNNTAFKKAINNKELKGLIIKDKIIIDDSFDKIIEFINTKEGTEIFKNKINYIKSF